MMNHQQHEPIGNPVDNWWNTIRQELDICVDLLRQFPPAPNSDVAHDILPTVQDILQNIHEAPFPAQAQKIRDYLLESLLYLRQSLKEQATDGILAPDSSHNIAHNKYLIVTYFLLQRGIYEPDPRSSKQQKTG